MLASTGSFSLYTMMYYELVPAYLCLGMPENPSSWQTCKREDFCDKDIQFKIDYSNTLSLHNWVSEYDMHCAPKVKFGLFGSLFFIGVVTSSLFFPPIAD